MDLLNIKIIETAIATVIYVAIRFVVNQSIEKTVIKSLMQKTRGKIVKKSVNLTLLIITLSIILIIWGIDQSQLVVFMTSLFTIIGIALFAQWSLLSNLTSGLIIFFDHSVRLDDTIRILDQDYDIEGRISDIGLFFVILETKEGDQITLPSNVFMQKMIRKKKNSQFAE